MDQASLFTSLKSIGLPVAYGEFVSTPKRPAPDPPFITYQFLDSADLMADNFNFAEISNFQIELYTGKKSIDIEQELQGKLKELKMPYSKSETNIPDEKLYQVIFTVQLI